MIRVMIVEDEPSSAERYASYVASFGSGFTVSSICHHTESALKEFQAETPDVILTDIRMPGGDGLALAAKLRKSGWPGQLVIVSGYNEFSYAQQAIHLGAAEFLLKPVFPEDMHRALSRLLDKVSSPDLDGVESAIVDVDLERLPEFLRRAMRYVAMNYGRRVSLRDAAKYAFVSSVYLSSSFKPALGCTFVEYVRRFRVGIAKRLLAAGGLALEEVAAKVGISDAAYFNKLFKRVERTTPGRYRKQHRNELDRSAT